MPSRKSSTWKLIATRWNPSHCVKSASTRCVSGLTFDLIPQVKVLVEAEEKKEEAQEPREARAKGPRRPRREAAESVEKAEPAVTETPVENIIAESAPAAEEAPKTAPAKEKKSKKVAEESALSVDEPVEVKPNKREES